MLVLLILIQEMVARLGVVTGKGLSDLIRERYGVKTTFYTMLALLITNLGNVTAEFAGLAASLEIFGVSRYVSVPLGAAAVWYLVVRGIIGSSKRCSFMHAPSIFPTLSPASWRSRPGAMSWWRW